MYDYHHIVSFHYTSHEIGIKMRCSWNNRDTDTAPLWRKNLLCSRPGIVPTHILSLSVMCCPHPPLWRQSQSVWTRGLPAASSARTGGPPGWCRCPRGSPRQNVREKCFSWVGFSGNGSDQRSRGEETWLTMIWTSASSRCVPLELAT